MSTRARPAKPNAQSIPVLFDIKRPLELQVDMVVVVDKLGNGRVVAACKHARGRRLRLDWRVG